MRPVCLGRINREVKTEGLVLLLPLLLLRCKVPTWTAQAARLIVISVHALVRHLPLALRR
jgi:hypothetical protein